jgi:hypothetical protein
MMTETTPKIFICYAHQDNKGGSNGERWLDRLTEQLGSLQLTEKAQIWSDKRIELGDDWHERIQETLQEVSVAVLLVSPSFLGSRYIRNSELPVLLRNAAESRGVTILPILLRPCLWRETTFNYPDPKDGDARKTYLQKIIEAIKELVADANLECNEEGISMQVLIHDFQIRVVYSILQINRFVICRQWTLHMFPFAQ